MIRLKRRGDSWESGQIQIFAVHRLIGLSPLKYVKDVRLILKRKFHIGWYKTRSYERSCLEIGTKQTKQKWERAVLIFRMYLRVHY